VPTAQIHVARTAFSFPFPITFSSYSLTQLLRHCPHHRPVDLKFSSIILGSPNSRQLKHYSIFKCISSCLMLQLIDDAAGSFRYYLSFHSHPRRGWVKKPPLRMINLIPFLFWWHLSIQILLLFFYSFVSEVHLKLPLLPLIFCSHSLCTKSWRILTL